MPTTKNTGSITTPVRIGSSPIIPLTIYAAYEPSRMKAGCAILAMSSMPKVIVIPTVTAA